MKIRKGFVSNSSSSSFVIALSQLLTCKKNLEELGDCIPLERLFSDIYSQNKDKVVCNSIHFISGCSEVEMLQPFSIDEVLTEYCGYKITRKDFDDELKGSSHSNYFKKESSELLEFLDSNKDKCFYMVEYEDSIDGEMEHEIMPYAKNTYRISKH